MRRPLLECAGGLGGGLLLAPSLPAPLGPVLSAAASLLALAGLPSARGRPVLLAFALGCLATGPPGLPEDGLAARIGAKPALVSLTGRVTSAPEPTRLGGRAFDLDLHSIRRPGSRSDPLRGRARVVVREASDPWRLPWPGDLVEVVGSVRPPLAPRNPGETARPGDPEQPVLLARAGAVRVLRSPAVPGPARVLAILRERAAARLASALPSPDAEIAAGLLLGRRTAIPPEIEEDFRLSGTVHLLAVSGLHVGLVAAAIHLLLGLVRIPPRPRVALVVLAVLGYAGLAGLRPPVVRAALLVALYGLARLLRRRTSPLDLLGAAAFLVLLARPSHAGRLDFQLSFLAVLGLIVLSPRIARALFPTREIESRFAAWREASPLRRVVRDHVHRVLPASWAAWLVTAPLVLLRFGLLTPAVLPGNLLLLPLLTLALLGAGAALALGPGPWSILLAGPLRGLRLAAGLVASCPGAAIEGDRPPLLAVLAAYAALALLARRCEWRRPHLAAATAIPFALALLVLPRTPPDRDRLTVLDVGQGSAVLVERADGGVLLYDAGSTTPDVGLRVLAPVLRSRRIRRIDLLVLSHADADHVSGAEHLLRRFDVAGLVVPGRFGDSPLGRTLLAAARGRGVPVRTVAAGDALPPFGEVVHPPPGADLGDNDGSLVVRVDLEGRRVILAGDLEEAGLDALLASSADLRAEALLLPHHGARNRRLPDLVVAVNPRVLLASAAPGFPSERLAPGSPPLRRTAERGALVVEARDRGLRVTGFLKGVKWEPSRTR